MKDDAKTQKKPLPKAEAVFHKIKTVNYSASGRFFQSSSV